MIEKMEGNQFLIKLFVIFIFYYYNFENDRYLYNLQICEIFMENTFLLVSNRNYH